MPVPEAELPILEALVTIRIRLTHLKKDRTEFIKPQDVLALYRQVIAQVHRLNEVREANEASLAENAEQSTSAPSSTPSHVDRLNAPLAALSLANESEAAGSSSSTVNNSNGTTSLMSQTQEEVQKEMNRVDTTLADVFQLLSLFFLTIGKSRSAPATYCQLAIITKLLDHMKESGVYTMNDLNPFKGRLNDLKTMILADMPSASKPSTPQLEDAPHPPRNDTSQTQNAWLEGDDPASRAALTKLLLKKHDRCTTRLKELITSLSVIGVELVPLHQKLITLRRQLVALSAKGIKTNKAEIDAIAEELRKIEAARVDGKFIVEGGVVKDGSEPPANDAANPESSEGDEADDDASAADEQPVIPPGQALLGGLLEETFEALLEIQSKEEEVSPLLQPIYERLTEMRAQLEKLNLTHRWTLRETDLYNFQVSLQEIDRMRKGGKFVDAEGNKPHGQRVLLFNIRRCYGLIYRLMSSSEPISEELMAIGNKIATIRRCLNEVLKFGGPFSAKDLYPYQLALAQIENCRVDGKFMGKDGTTMPEGQAILNANLSESYEMLEMLKEDMEQE